jgi:hypothetical protein
MSAGGNRGWTGTPSPSVVSEVSNHRHQRKENGVRSSRLWGKLLGCENTVMPKYVRVVVKAFLGNGYGVSDAALPYYDLMLRAFDPRQAARALRAFTDPAVYSVLRSASGEGQWTALLTLLGPKLTLPADRALFDAIRGFTGPPNQLHADTNIVRLAGTRRNTSKAAVGIAGPVVRPI